MLAYLLIAIFSKFDRSFLAVSFAASNLGYAVSFVPDAKKAAVAAEAIFEILHRHPRLQPDEGDFPDHQTNGDIVFNNLRFRYPTRKKVPVLRVRLSQVDLEVEFNIKYTSY